MPGVLKSGACGAAGLASAPGSALGGPPGARRAVTHRTPTKVAQVARCPGAAHGRLPLPVVRLAGAGSMASYPLMPWATCPWCADSCSAPSSAALRCGLMSKTTFRMVPVNENGARSA